MFKSVFAKYIFAFMLIIAISFAMLASIVGSVVNSYSVSAKTESVRSASEAVVNCIEKKQSFEDISDFSAFCDIYSDDINTVLDAVVAASADDLTVFVADNGGKIILSNSGEGGRSLKGKQLPKDIMDNLNSGVELESADSIEGIIYEKSLISATPIYLNDSYVCGTVFACVNAGSDEGLGAVMTRTLLLASLWVMLAALIAVYFITERVISPLKEMSRAAKSFAAGNFDVRVPVVGDDEVAELARAFNNMAKSLEALDDMRNNFMSSVSHDMRTPMTTISGFIDCILSGAIPPEKHEHYLKIIRDEVQRLSRLVSTLLDISRIQAGDRKFVMAPFDICEMGRQVLISCEQRIDAKHLEVEFDIDDDNMYVNGDHDAIYQIMYNICDNAIKFSRDGGLLRISVKYAENKKVSVSVFNEGEGIPLEDQPYIFERFYKSDRSRGIDKTGVGLGMFIAKTIINAHGEDIKLNSVPGENCEFVFTLPRAQTPARHGALQNRNGEDDA